MKISWNKGKKLSEQHREKLRLSHLGKALGNKYRLGKSPWNKGKEWSPEMREKLSLAHIGKIYSSSFKKGHTINVGKTYSEEHRKKISNALTGKKLSFAHRQKLSEVHKGYIMPEEVKHKMSNIKKGKMPKNFGIQFLVKGEDNHSWKGGITPENMKIRHSVEIRLWRESVFARDNWTCQKCLEKGGKLQADHIKPFSVFPELRFAIDNGQTLCIPCHKLKTQNDLPIIKSMQMLNIK